MLLLGYDPTVKNTEPYAISLTSPYRPAEDYSLMERKYWEIFTKSFSGMPLLMPRENDGSI